MEEQEADKMIFSPKSGENIQVNVANANIGSINVAPQSRGSACEPDRQPSLISRIRPPVDKNKMLETKKFRDIYDRAKNEKLWILQCLGVPGSGKSQIIRKLGENFPSTDDELTIKWHIQCKDSGHDVKEELKHLAKKLLTHNHKNMTLEKYQSIVDDLDVTNAKLLSDALIEGDVPTLIIIEDPPSNCRPLLDNLCHNFASNLKRASKKIHLYITSRTSLLSRHFFSSKSSGSCFQQEKVNGFDIEEAVEYLGLNGEKSEEKQAARRICKRFSGLPLGLQAAKGYCTNARIEYQDYLELVDDVDWDIMEKEKKQIAEDYGENAEHVFQAIVMPFIPDDDSDTSGILQWKILSCISYFNYDRIPRHALEYCCHMLREKAVKKPQIRNKADIGSLVTKLLDHGMCSETAEEEITFHEVILNSFRLNNRPFLDKNKFDPLKKALKIMCGLVSKDMRKKDHSSQMHKLRRHLQSLLEHIAKDENIFDDEADALLLKALTSHLHETAAAIMLNESPLYWEESNKNFEQALELLWEERISYANPKSDTTPDEIAQKIVNESNTKSKELPKDFAVRYASKLEYCMDEKEKDFLESKSKSLKGKNRFKHVENNLKTQDCKEKLVKLLQDCDVFLSNEHYKTVFYAERFASILHSWSRLVLYAEPEFVERDEKCMWMSSLCQSICVQCKKLCDVPLLIERLSVTGGLFPILLKQKTDSDVLKQALDTCESSLCKKKDEPMYENGLLKEVYGPSFVGNRVSLLRNIVRISARLIGVNRNLVQEKADKNCHDLFRLAQENAKENSNCIMCIIYCAKYYAAKGEARSSLDCFEKYFDLEPDCQPRFSVRCWAIYNYARAVISFSSRSKQDDATAKCKEVLNTQDVITRSLKEHLQECLKNLKTMTAQGLKRTKYSKSELDPNPKKQTRI